MKEVILIFMMLISGIFSIHAQNAVGKISDGKYIITIATNEIKAIGESLLAKQGVNYKLTSFEILQDKVENTNDAYYFLLVKNNNNSLKMATLLKLENDSFYSDGDYLFDSFVTCEGCKNDCSPRRLISHDGIIDWYCTSCTEGKGKTCTKSVTIN